MNCKFISVVLSLLLLLNIKSAISNNIIYNEKSYLINRQSDSVFINKKDVLSRKQGLWIEFNYVVDSYILMTEFHTSDNSDYEKSIEVDDTNRNNYNYYWIGKYINDRKDGNWLMIDSNNIIVKNYFFRKGFLTKIEIFYSNGIIKMEGVYSDKDNKYTFKFNNTEGVLQRVEKMLLEEVKKIFYP